jgi:hypothetical protein
MTDRGALAILVMIHLAVVAIVQPRGEFPLNDDWAFAHSVQWLLAEGRVRLSDWVAMNLVPQTLAGGAVALAFGFSFEALRHLTQVVALVAMGMAYAWFRANRLQPAAAVVATAAMVSFPAWPVLANSYMTDVHGLVLALPAATLFLRTLERPSRGALAAATLLSIAGVLQRQVALAIPFAFMVAWLWTRRPLTPRAVAAAVLPFALTVAAAAAFHAYLVLGPGVPQAQLEAHGRVLPMAMKALVNEDRLGEWAASNAATMGGYLGVFTVGWLAWWGMGGASRRRKVFVIVAGCAIAAAAFGFGWYAPYRPDNVIDAAGIGPFMVHDAIRGLAPLDRSAGLFWRALALPAAFATAALLLALGMTIGAVRRRDDAGTVFVAAILAAYLAPFVVTDYFDRYLLFALPFACALWARLWPAPTASSPRQALAILWIAGAIGLGAAATRDYFSWNRARWDAIRAAEAQGAGAETLDGGFEYNALRRFEASSREPVAGKSWWWVKDDRYVVAFSTVPGYREIGRWEVRRWLPRTPGEVKLLRREP